MKPYLSFCLILKLSSVLKVHADLGWGVQLYCMRFEYMALGSSAAMLGLDAGQSTKGEQVQDHSFLHPSFQPCVCHLTATQSMLTVLKQNCI